MSEEEIREEICTVFDTAFDGDRHFPFKFLQSVGSGSNCLTIPCTSSSFEWTAKEIISSVGKGALYILAQKEIMKSHSEDKLTIEGGSWRYDIF